MGSQPQVWSIQFQAQYTLAQEVVPQADFCQQAVVIR